MLQTGNLSKLIVLIQVCSNTYIYMLIFVSSFGFNKVALDGSSNAVPLVKAKSDVEPPTEPEIEPSSSDLVNEESISQFFTQVASLVK